MPRAIHNPIRLIVITVASTFSSQTLADELDFDGVVRPFLKQHCASCHAGEDGEAAIDLDQPFVNYSADVWQRVRQVLQFDEMPPRTEIQPDPVAAANVIRWIDQQLAESGLGESYHRKLLYAH